MRLLYYRGAAPNFGDDLNLLLWPSIRPDLFAAESAEGFVGIGTIIGRSFDQGLALTVVSSGLGNNPVDAWARRPVRYVSVRGPLTAHLLGLSPDHAVADGAILVRALPGLQDAPAPAPRPVVVPHWQSLTVPGWAEAARLLDYTLLDPRTTPDIAVRTIASAPFVLTESLHGAIIADLYGVPWAAFMSSRNVGVFKWVDWAMSVGRTFRATVIPPPHHALLRQFGRRPEPSGRLLSFTADDAFADPHFAAPSATGPSAWHSAKSLLKNSPVSRLIYHCSPERTAHHLHRLATRLESPSPAHRLNALIDNLMSRLTHLQPLQASP